MKQVSVVVGGEGAVPAEPEGIFVSLNLSLNTYL